MNRRSHDGYVATPDWTVTAATVNPADRIIVLLA